MQAIKTKYHGPTNSKGSRISASCEAGRIYMPYNHALGLYENHATAAALLIEKLGWGAHQYVGGQFEHDYYWCADMGAHEWNDTHARDYTKKVAA